MISYFSLQLDHSGEYICEAIGYPASVPGAQVAVTLSVERREYLNLLSLYTQLLQKSF